MVSGLTVIARLEWGTRDDRRRLWFFVSAFWVLVLGSVFRSTVVRRVERCAAFRALESRRKVILFCGLMEWFKQGFLLLKKKKKGNGESDFIGLNYGFVAIWVSLYCLLFLFLLLVLLLFFFFFLERATSWDYAFWLFFILYFGCVLMKRGFHLWAFLLWPFTWRVKLSDSMAWLCFVVNASGTCSCTYSVVLWSSGPLFGCLEVWFCAYPVFAHLIGFLISLLAFEEAFSQLG